MLALFTKLEGLIAKLNALDAKGAFSAVLKTPVKVNKFKRGDRTSPTPQRYIGVEKLKFTTISCGNNYEKLVNGRREKEDKAPDFQTEDTYCVPLAENRLVWKHKEKDQYYLRGYLVTPSFKTTTVYIAADGSVLSLQEVEDIYTNYMSPKSENVKQGLENPVEVRNIKLENVIYLKRGEIFINELTAGMLEMLGAHSA